MSLRNARLHVDGVYLSPVGLKSGEAGRHTIEKLTLPSDHNGFLLKPRIINFNKVQTVLEYVIIVIIGSRIS